MNNLAPFQRKRKQWKKKDSKNSKSSIILNTINKTKQTNYRKKIEIEYSQYI